MSFIKVGASKLFAWTGNFVNEIKRRRIHLWAGAYFIGLFNLLDPIIGVFGWSEYAKTIGNVGLAIYPLIILLSWFHGEPGPQNFSKTEGISLCMGALLSIFILAILSRTPKPSYTIVLPSEVQKNVWLKKNILNKFEKTNHVKINIETFGANYGKACANFLSSKQDTNDILLAKIPLSFTGVLLNDYNGLIIPFEDIYDDDSNLDYQDLVELKSKLDKNAVKYGANLVGDGKLYYLPAEFTINLQAYSQSKVDEACQHWKAEKVSFQKKIKSLTGYSLPSDYVLERDPGLWDPYDLFVANWFWAKETENVKNVHVARFAIPTAEDFNTFSALLDRALCFGVRLDHFYNLPVGIEPDSWTPLANLFYWDVLFRQTELFYSGMWLGQGISTNEIAEALKNGSIYLGILPSDIIYDVIHTNPDIKVATLTSGLDFSRGRINPAGFNNIWFYAIPKNSPSYSLSIKLTTWLTNNTNQSLMMHEFLTLPSNNELLEQKFSSHHNRVDSSYAILLEQFQINQQKIINLAPINPFKDLGEAEYTYLIKYYHKKWWEIVNSKNILNNNYKTTLEIITGNLNWPTTM